MSDQEEDDFVPGAEDEEDDSDDFYEEDEDLPQEPILDGILSLDESKLLTYKGERFNLQGTEPLAFNILNAKEHNLPVTVTLTGVCELEDRPGKAAPRKIAVTIAASAKNGGSKTSSDNDDEKDSVNLFHISGKEESLDGAECLEFRGSFQSTTGNSTGLRCHARLIQSTASASAAAAPRAHDALSDDELEEGVVEVDELIGLHEDAGLSVEDLRKRYHGGEESPPKKIKIAEEDEDDEDEEYGF